MSALRRSDLVRLLRSQMNALALADADDRERPVLRRAAVALGRAMDDLDRLDREPPGQLALDMPTIYDPNGDAP